MLNFEESKHCLLKYTKPHMLIIYYNMNGLKKGTRLLACFTINIIVIVKAPIKSRWDIYTIKNRTDMRNIALSNKLNREGGNRSCKWGPYMAKNIDRTENTYTFSTRISGLTIRRRAFITSSII